MFPIHAANKYLAPVALRVPYLGHRPYRCGLVSGHERGMASAIFNSAQYAAQVFFVPLMAWLVHSFGWPYVFYVMGGLGILFTLV